MGRQDQDGKKWGDKMQDKKNGETRCETEKKWGDKTGDEKNGETRRETKRK